VTNTEFAVGTPGYMCPEQARGDEMDNRGDLYSVGVILYELLTGRLPFAGKSTMDMLLAHATEEPPSFDHIGAAGGIPSAIEGVVQSCLAKDPSMRPRHARELAELYEQALASSLGSAAESPLPAPLYPQRPSLPAFRDRPPLPSPLPAAELEPGPESDVNDPL